VTGGRHPPRRANIAWPRQWGIRRPTFLGWDFLSQHTLGLARSAEPAYWRTRLQHRDCPMQTISRLLANRSRLFSHWLPEPFQYFGIWLLCCFHASVPGFGWLLTAWVREGRFQLCLWALLFCLRSAVSCGRLQGPIQSDGGPVARALASLYLCFLGRAALARVVAWQPSGLSPPG